MRQLGMVRDAGTGGGPAGELGIYQMRRVRRSADRPLGNCGRMGALVFLSGRVLPHREVESLLSRFKSFLSEIPI
jgi:hypothetical protein